MAIFEYRDGKLIIDLNEIPVYNDVGEDQVEIRIGRFPGGVNDFPSVRIKCGTDFRSIAKNETIGKRLRGILGGL